MPRATNGTGTAKHATAAVVSTRAASTAYNGGAKGRGIREGKRGCGGGGPRPPPSVPQRGRSRRGRVLPLLLLLLL
jgi:hypothetical protein